MSTYDTTQKLDQGRKKRRVGVKEGHTKVEKYVEVVGGNVVSKSKKFIITKEDIRLDENNGQESVEGSRTRFNQSHEYHFKHRFV